MSEIKEAVKHYIAQLPHIGEELPSTWIKVRKVLESVNRNYISINEFFEICDDNGFTREKDKLQLSGYLHDLGAFLHFQEDLLLKKTVILKPSWGTDAVYKVLDNYAIINNFGIFTKADLTRIWTEEKYRGMHAELLQLMLNF